MARDNRTGTSNAHTADEEGVRAAGQNSMRDEWHRRGLPTHLYDAYAAISPMPRAPTHVRRADPLVPEPVTPTDARAGQTLTELRRRVQTLFSR